MKLMQVDKEIKIKQNQNKLITKSEKFGSYTHGSNLPQAVCNAMHIRQIVYTDFMCLFYLLSLRTAKIFDLQKI